MINGRNIKVYAGSLQIAAAKSCVLSYTHTPVETVPTADWRFRTYTEGKQTWKITISGLVVADATATKKNPLDILSDMGSQLTMKFDHPQGGKIGGSCYPTEFQFQAEVNKLATYSLTLLGSGPLA